MSEHWDEIIEPAPGSYAALVGLRMTRRDLYEETTGRFVPDESQSGLWQIAPLSPADEKDAGTHE